MYRRRLILLIILVCMALLTGCGSDAAVIDNPEDYKTVIDCFGRQVQVPREIERIGCLYSFSGHVVTMLGRGGDIVAVSNGLKRDAILTEICPTILDAAVPKGNGAINLEELAKSKPDVVFIDEEFALNEAVAEKFKKFNIPYLGIKYGNIDEQIYAVNMIAEAINATETAGKYEAYYRETVRRVKARVGDIPEEDRIRVFHSVNEASRTDAPDTLPADWIKVAGAINVSVEEDLKLIGNKYFASMEQILLWDPDVIIVNEGGVDEYIMTDRKWQNLKAVKENRVYRLPNGVSRWGHPGSLETPLAILWAAKKLYPEYMQDVDMEAETKWFYEEFYRYTLSDETVKDILNGEWMREPKN